MMSIWKYPLSEVTYQIVHMPVGAKILRVANLHNKTAMWAVVDTNAPVEKRHFKLYGTGQEVLAEPFAEATHDYIGTYFRHGGLEVTHLFEIKPT